MTSGATVSPWIAMIGVVVGALISGGTAVLVRKQENRARRLEKLEERKHALLTAQKAAASELIIAVHAWISPATNQFLATSDTRKNGHSSEEIVRPEFLEADRRFNAALVAMRLLTTDKSLYGDLETMTFVRTSVIELHNELLQTVVEAPRHALDWHQRFNSMQGKLRTAVGGFEEKIRNEIAT